jgi:hypothetical protein
MGIGQGFPEDAKEKERVINALTNMPAFNSDPPANEKWMN